MDYRRGKKKDRPLDEAELKGLLRMFLTAGGEVLLRDFGFTSEQASKWGILTLSQVGIYSGIVEERPGEPKVETRIEKWD